MVQVEIAFAPLETPLHGCNDGADNDGDGWADVADPDCSAGNTEVGTGPSACNDGVDNDRDGAVDAADDYCADAYGNSEAPPCEDGVDNDGDGWSDSEDPDCADLGYELGVAAQPATTAPTTMATAMLTPPTRTAPPHATTMRRAPV